MWGIFNDNARMKKTYILYYGNYLELIEQKYFLLLLKDVEIQFGMLQKTGLYIS